MIQLEKLTPKLNMAFNFLCKIITFFFFFLLLLRGITGEAVNMQPNNWYDVIMATEHRDNFCFNYLRKQKDIIDEMKDRINKLEKDLAIGEVRNKDWEKQLENNDNFIKMQEELIKNLKLQQNLENNYRLPDGIYSTQKIQIPGQQPFDVPYFSQSSGWTVIQRRMDGSVDFNRNWEEYKTGFGDINKEFFIGLEKLYLLTRNVKHELYIRLGDVDGVIGYAIYDDFIVGSEEENYRLKSIGNYRGTAGDSLSVHLGLMFSTKDRDNDLAMFNCAALAGGWWFNQCGYCQLNGNYNKNGISLQQDGITWGTWKNLDYKISLTFTQMMIRPIFP